jgi:hypothetical protein
LRAGGANIYKKEYIELRLIGLAREKYIVINKKKKARCEGIAAGHL